MSEVSREHIVALLERAGLVQVAAEAARTLPEVLERDRAEEFLAQRGVTMSQLINWLGGSP